MTHINAAVLEQLSQQELQALYTGILDELVRSGKTIDECPHTALTLANIRKVLQRRKPKGPRL